VYGMVPLPPLNQTYPVFVSGAGHRHGKVVGPHVGHGAARKLRHCGECCREARQEDGRHGCRSAGARRPHLSSHGWRILISRLPGRFFLEQR